jgi:ankyrin repeat protein
LQNFHDEVFPIAYKIVLNLVENNADPNHRNNKGRTALIYATKKESYRNR